MYVMFGSAYVCYVWKRLCMLCLEALMYAVFGSVYVCCVWIPKNKTYVELPVPVYTLGVISFCNSCKMAHSVEKMFTCCKIK